MDTPFDAPSALPYELPPFDEIRSEHFLPAFERAMRVQRAEVEAITGSDEQPTFANTLVALERTGRMLYRVQAAFFTLTGADSTDEIRAIEETVSPLLAAHRDAMPADPRTSVHSTRSASSHGHGEYGTSSHAGHVHSRSPTTPPPAAYASSRPSVASSAACRPISGPTGTGSGAGPGATGRAADIRRCRIR